MITPTIGRVVLYHPPTKEIEGRIEPDLRERPGFAYGDTCAAIIAAVNDDGTLNLTVFDSTGATHPHQNVTLVQEDTAYVVADGYAEWMSYQKGQAAKNDDELAQALDRIAALEARIAVLDDPTGRSAPPDTPPPGDESSGGSEDGDPGSPRSRRSRK